MFGFGFPLPIASIANKLLTGSSLASWEVDRGELAIVLYGCPVIGFRSFFLCGESAQILPLAIYTHTVGEDDRLLAEQLGEMLCPNVAKLAQEKTFAVSEGVVIQ